MKSLSEIARTAVNELATALKPFALAPCWETMITGLLAHRLWHLGFTLQLPDGIKGDHVTLSNGEYASSRKDRTLWLHNADDEGCTDICISSPSIAHFEIKSGAFAGSKSDPNHKELAKDLERSLVIEGYECIISLLVADSKYYAQLCNPTKHGNTSDEGWQLRTDLSNFYPSLTSLTEEIKQMEAKWRDVSVTHLCRNAQTDDAREIILIASLRTEHIDTVFPPD